MYTQVESKNYVFQWEENQFYCFFATIHISSLRVLAFTSSTHSSQRIIFSLISSLQCVAYLSPYQFSWIYFLQVSLIRFYPHNFPQSFYHFLLKMIRKPSWHQLLILIFHSFLFLAPQKCFSYISWFRKAIWDIVLTWDNTKVKVSNLIHRNVSSCYASTSQVSTYDSKVRRGSGPPPATDWKSFHT